MTYVQVTCFSCTLNVHFENKSQNPKMALCGVLIGKLILFGSIDYS